MIAAIDHLAEVTVASVPESLLGAPTGPRLEQTPPCSRFSFSVLVSTDYP